MVRIAQTLIAPFAAALASLATSPSALAAVFPRNTLPGQCESVRGRMRLYNGTFSFRIWVIGTHRMLRVVDADGDNFNDIEGLPRPLADALRPIKDDLWTRSVYARFTVCAFTRRRPGWMQSVNLTGAKAVRVVVDPG
jgi:hypothetical protein